MFKGLRHLIPSFFPSLWFCCIFISIYFIYYIIEIHLIACLFFIQIQWGDLGIHLNKVAKDYFNNNDFWLYLGLEKSRRPVCKCSIRGRKEEKDWGREKEKVREWEEKGEGRATDQQGGMGEGGRGPACKSIYHTRRSARSFQAQQTSKQSCKDSIRLTFIDKEMGS